MKLSALMLALPLMSLSIIAEAGGEGLHRTFKPQSSEFVNSHVHTEHALIDERAPSSASERVLDFVESNSLLSTLQVMNTCNLDALASANSTQLLNEIRNQGSSCINELFSANSTIQKHVFTSDKMFAAANQAKALGISYIGTGSGELEALFLFIRAGYYVEFYHDGVTFASWVKPAVKDAIDAFVKNSHFYDNNDAHGRVLSEVITTMDSSEQQGVYLPVVKQWLSRFDQSYASVRNMHRAINGVFTILYRGQWNANFKSLVQTDTALVQSLKEFTKKSWLIGADAEYLMVNAAGELARLKTYKNAAIQDEVDTALIALFSTYKSFGYGDAIWLNAADVASYYGDCNKYNICNFVTELTAQALPQVYQCSDTVKIRSQEMTSLQHASACQKMAEEETRFHTRLKTNKTPVADDHNTFVQVNVFNSSDDYRKYAKAIFKIDTNNGGMYLEGDPSKVGNQANFIAYEASYAKADHFVWNLEHEYVHYLDGRFDLYGDFNAPTEAIVWWSEGVAEYIANQNDNQAAIDTIKDGSTYTLDEVFATTYAGFDQDRIYRWGYLAVRFLFETHNDELNTMLTHTRAGDWSAYKTLISSWANQYGEEFTTWTQALAGGVNNSLPTAVINGPYNGHVNQAVQFSSQGSQDTDGEITAYVWAFGDGAQSNELNPAHHYSSVGEYTVSLTVTDNQGATHTRVTTATISSHDIDIIALQKGKSITINGAQDALSYFTIDVPAGAQDLNVMMSQGSGDADLYVRFGSKPTLNEYDCRPYQGGNDELCHISAPSQGQYYVMVRGYNRYSEVQLLADYINTTPSLPDACQTQGTVSGGRLVSDQPVCLSSQDPMWFSLENVSGYSSVTIESAHGTGDLTLEYSNSGWPTDTNVDARSNQGGNTECINLDTQSQYWGYLKVSGSSTGATLQVTYDGGRC